MAKWRDELNGTNRRAWTERRETWQRTSRSLDRSARAAPADRRSCCPSWSPTCGRTARELRQEWAEPDHRRAPALGDDRRRRSSPRRPRSTTTTSRCSRRAASRRCSDYARDLSERIIPRGVETHEVVGIVLLLRDVLARSLFEKYQRRLRPAQPRARRLRAGRQPHRQHGGGQLRRGARAGHPPAAGRAPRAVDPGAAGPRAAADPADHRRARHAARPASSPNSCCAAIRAHRAKVVVIDITGVPDVDETVANHLVQTVDASRLMGAERDHHRPVLGDRADAGDHRCRPQQDERGRRPAGRHRGGRTAARVPGLEGARCRLSRPDRTARAAARLDPQAGAEPDRVHPRRARRRQLVRLQQRPRSSRSAGTARGASSSTSPRSTSSTRSPRARCATSPT